MSSAFGALMPFATNAGQYEATYFSVKSDLISAQRQEKRKGLLISASVREMPRHTFTDSTD